MSADAIANARNRAANIAWIAANPVIVAEFNRTPIGAALINSMRTSPDTMGGSYAEIYRLAGGDGLKIPQVQAQYFQLQSGGLLAGVSSFINAFPAYVPVAVGIGAALVGAGGLSNLIDSVTGAPVTAAANSEANSIAQSAFTGTSSGTVWEAPGAGVFSPGNSLISGATVMDTTFSTTGIFDTINGVTGALLGTYGAFQNLQLQKTQIDANNAVAIAAARQSSAQATASQSSAGKTNWTMIGLIGAALLGVVLMVRK